MKKEHVEQIEKIIGYTFKSKSLLEQAYTFRSYEQEHPKCLCNETLELIGDSVLSRSVTEMAIKEFTEIRDARLFSKRSEGDISKWRSNFVQQDYLAQKICELNLDKSEYFNIGKGDLKNKIYERKHIKENLAEAIIGAVAIDSNFNASAINAVVEKLLFENQPVTSIKQKENYVGLVQEWFQGQGIVVPHYSYRQQDDIWYCFAVIADFSLQAENKTEGASTKNFGFGEWTISEPVYEYGYYIGKTEFEAVGANKQKVKEMVAEDIWHYIQKRQAELIKDFSQHQDYNNIFGGNRDIQIANFIKKRFATLKGENDSYINILQELFQINLILQPTYAINNIGNIHQPMWQVFLEIETVNSPKRISFVAKDTNKKTARKFAARGLLLKLLEMAK